MLLHLYYNRALSYFKYAYLFYLLNPYLFENLDPGPIEDNIVALSSDFFFYLL